MEKRRLGESGPIPFRTGRFFNVGVNWYFATREAIDQGPFRSRSEAESALTQYIEKCRTIEATWG